MEGIRFEAELVVLSACQTAVGQDRGGDGLVGLTRAFQIAGARSVVASLWNVADETTSDLMVRFHQRYLEGKPKDESLQAAQVELIRTPISGDSARRHSSRTRRFRSVLLGRVSTLW